MCVPVYPSEDTQELPLEEHLLVLLPILQEFVDKEKDSTESHYVFDLESEDDISYVRLFDGRYEMLSFDYSESDEDWFIDWDAV